MENQGETWSSYDDYYENFDTHCDQFEGNEDLYHAYDPAALDWSGEVALFDDGFALTIPVIDWYDPATQVTADDIWGDLEDGAVHAALMVMVPSCFSVLMMPWWIAFSTMGCSTMWGT